MNKGIIAIAESIYMNQYGHVGLIFQKFRPYRIERNYHHSTDVVIWGDSDLFEPIAEGEVIPHYTVVFTTDGYGTVSFQFVRMH